MLDADPDGRLRAAAKLAQLAESQLGTVGSGNHYVNLMEDEEGRIWVGVHFGSRGFGHKTASGFLALAQGLPFDGRAHEGEMDSPPVLFELGSELGESYIAAMELAGDYAYAGRDVVVAKVLEILGAEAAHEVHNHHNFAWREEHFGRTYWVVRKGCTPARPGQEGFVGGSMGDESVILEGVESAENEQALYSTVHGAGRVMSRTQAAGRVRRRSGGRAGTATATALVRDDASACPDHPDAGRDEGLGRGAGQAGRRRLAGGAGAAARAGHRARRRRRGRGAGGVQAPARGPRRARRLDPRQAHGCARSASPWPAATCTTRTRTESPRERALGVLREIHRRAKPVSPAERQLSNRRWNGRGHASKDRTRSRARGLRNHASGEHGRRSWWWITDDAHEPAHYRDDRHERLARVGRVEGQQLLVLRPAAGLAAASGSIRRARR